MSYKNQDVLARRYIHAQNPAVRRHIRKQIIESGSSLAYFLFNIVPTAE